MNYSKCVIYKIQHQINKDLIYIGHTTKSLNCRLSSHICMSKKSNNKFYTIVKNNGGFENFDIILIDIYPCQTKEEACIREEYFRCSLNAIMNSNRAYISVEDKKVVIKQRNTDWYIKNKPYVLDKRRQYYKENYETIIERVTLYRHKNKSILNEKARAKYNQMKSIMENHLNL